MIKRLVFLLVLIAALSVMAACGGDSGDQQTGDVAPAATEVAESSSPAENNVQATATPVPPKATDTPAPPPATDTPEADEDISPETLAALDELDFYRAETIFTSAGVDQSGNERESTFTIQSAYTADPMARYMKMTGTEMGLDAMMGAEGIEFYQVDQDMYMYVGEETGWVRVQANSRPLTIRPPACCWKAAPSSAI